MDLGGAVEVVAVVVAFEVVVVAAVVVLVKVDEHGCIGG